SAAPADGTERQCAANMVEKGAGVAFSSIAGRSNLENYKGQNGILSVKTLVLGGEFRVTTIVPFKGNVADYTRLEIARPVSLVGKALSADVASKQLAKIKSQFESRRIFESVTVIESYDARVYAQRQEQSGKQSDSGASEKHADDSLEAPMGTLQDM